MARTRWFDPLLAFLHDQLLETDAVTLTLAELEALAGQPLPISTLLRSYWWDRQAGSLHRRVAVVGWQVVQARRRDQSLTITFARTSPDAIVLPILRRRR